VIAKPGTGIDDLEIGPGSRNNQLEAAQAAKCSPEVQALKYKP